MYNSTIYILQHFSIRDTIKIGHTSNIVNRLRGYITPEPIFDNTTHKLWTAQFASDKYTGAMVDDIINHFSTKFSYPFKKFKGTGGNEHYYIDDLSRLEEFFEKVLNLNFTKLKQEDIDSLREQSNRVPFENLEFVDTKNDILVDYNVLEEKYKKIIDKKIKLKEHQLEVCKLVNEFAKNKRLSHIVISPTGTGKSWMYEIISTYFIEKGNILIMTKRTEVIKQIFNGLYKDLLMFKHNGIIDIDPNKINIRDYISKFSAIEINKEPKNTIVVTNNDQFTSNSSRKDDYKKVNWDKFSLIIIDESHWCGSKEMHDFMIYIKEKTKVNYLGFSATPIRCIKEHKDNVKDIFKDSNSDDLNVLFELSYMDAILEKLICPIKWVSIDMQDKEDFYMDKDKKGKKMKILSEKSFGKLWDLIKKQIIDKCHNKKGILRFRSRRELLSYYNMMKNKIEGFKLHVTFSGSSNDDQNFKDLLKKSSLFDEELKSGIDDFKKEESNAILFAVHRCTEGFNDPKLDFSVRMFFSKNSDPVNETQQMGRLNRFPNNDPNGPKKFGYFGTVEYSFDEEEKKKNLISRLRSWIDYVMENSRNHSSRTQKIDENKIKQDIINSYFDSDIIDKYEIDIKKELENFYKRRSKEFEDIVRAVKVENFKRESYGIELIKSKPVYNLWAKKNNYPDCDQLEDMGYDNLSKLFGIKSGDYLEWDELKKLCRKYQNKYGEKMSCAEIYSIMEQEREDVPLEPEIYYDNFRNYRDLFY